MDKNNTTEKTVLLRLLETVEGFLKRKKTIGDLRRATREARKTVDEEDQHGQGAQNQH